MHNDEILGIPAPTISTFVEKRELRLVAIYAGCVVLMRGAARTRTKRINGGLIIAVDWLLQTDMKRVTLGGYV